MTDSDENKKGNPSDEKKVDDEAYYPSLNNSL